MDGSMKYERWKRNQHKPLKRGFLLSKIYAIIPPMSNLNTHTSTGSAYSAGFALASYQFGFCQTPTDAIVIFLICWLGSILPDIDSDGGIPMLILFPVISMGAVALLIFYGVDDFLYYELARAMPEQITMECKSGIQFGLSFGTWLLINGFDWKGKVFPVCLRYAFMKWTVHRGITHSILGVIFAHQAALTSLNHIGYNYPLLAANALIFGWTVHLFLDVKRHSGEKSGQFWKPGEKMFPFKLLGIKRNNNLFFGLATVLMLGVNYL